MTLATEVYIKTKSFKDYTAIRCDSKSLSYSELNDRALIIASLILLNGKKNRTIGLVGGKHISSYIGILGIIYSGCNYTPINSKYNTSRIKSIIDSTKIEMLVGDKESIENLQTKGIDISEFKILIPNEFDNFNSKWIYESDIDKKNKLKEPISNKISDLCYILFTSGSTGKPKGVKINNKNILSFLKNMSNIYKLDPGFNASQTFDFSFDPSVSDIFFTWISGGTLCVLPDNEKLIPSDFIKREKINFWNSVPSIASFMHKMGHLSEGIFPSLKYSMFCGEQFPKSLADQWKKAAPNSTIENLYGPTEATIYISRYVYSDFDKKKEFKNGILPIGLPFDKHNVKLVDEHNNLKNIGDAGEICFSGNQISNGYFNDVNRTKNAFTKIFDNKIWYKTGDLGFINNDGLLECIGRIDNQIKIAGRRVEIGEIEYVLSKFNLTKNSVVVPIRDKKNNIVIGCIAFIENKITSNQELDIRSKSIKYLDKVFFPKKIISISKFPINISGKIDRKELEKLISYND